MNHETPTQATSLLDRPVEWRRMTPEEVLNVLAEHRRFEIQYNHALAEPPVAFETSIAEWDDAGVHEWLTLRWHGIGQWINSIFETHIPAREWLAAIHPANRKTLRNLCEIVALRAEIPVTRPVSIFERECKEAGAFLTIRGLLREAGLDATHIAPTTPLADHGRAALPVVFNRLLKLRPAILNVCRITQLSEALHMAAAIVLLLATPVLGLLARDRPWLAFLSLLTFGAFLWIWRDSVRRQKRLREVVFDESLTSFGDLARWLANRGETPDLR